MGHIYETEPIQKTAKDTLKSSLTSPVLHQWAQLNYRSDYWDFKPLDGFLKHSGTIFLLVITLNITLDKKAACKIGSLTLHRAYTTDLNNYLLSVIILVKMNPYSNSYIFYTIITIIECSIHDDATLYHALYLNSRWKSKLTNQIVSMKCAHPSYCCALCCVGRTGLNGSESLLCDCKPARGSSAALHQSGFYSESLTLTDWGMTMDELMNVWWAPGNAHNLANASLQWSTDLAASCYGAAQQQQEHGGLVRMEGEMNAAKYREGLLENLLTFQQDSDLKQTADNCKAALGQVSDRPQSAKVQM